MNGLPTQDPHRMRRPSTRWSLPFVFAVSFGSAIGAVRDWTDVKVAVATAAALCVRTRRVNVVAALGGVLLGHVILGSTVDVLDRSIAAWIVCAVIASGEAAVLVGILRSSIAEADTMLPSRRISVFVFGAMSLAVVGGLLESWLLETMGVAATTSSVDTMFGVGIGACLAAIAVTRSRSEWLSSSRTTGAELLAPLMVILVALVAVQVTRQVWSQRDDDQLDVLAGSVDATLTARWDRETQVLRSKADSIAPAVAFDESAFESLMKPFLEANDVAVAAALGTRSASAGKWTLIASVQDQSQSTPVAITDDLWRDTPTDGADLVDLPDRDGVGTSTVIVESVDLVRLPDGGRLVMAVAYSVADLVRSVTSDGGVRYEEIVIGVETDASSSTTSAWSSSEFDRESNAKVVSAGSIPVGDTSLLFTISPTSDFGSPTSTLLALVALEIGIGLLLCGVLVLGANAQFKMTQERRRRENLLEAALDATPGFSVVFDQDFRVLAANRPIRSEFADRIPGLDVGRVFGLESDSGRRRMVEEVLKRALDGEPAHMEIAQDSDDGRGGAGASASRMKIIELSAYPVTTPGGEPIGFLHGVDATDRRNLAMRSAQSERMESLGALAGGLAHDFNNLLFVTLGNLQLMAMNETVVADEKLSKFVSRSMAAVERGAEITKSLLAVARSQPLEESAVSLSELVKGLLPLVRQALGAGRRVEVDIADPSLQLMVDSGRLSSCILNLAFNSRDAMGANGILRIAARFDETTDMIELSVADDGAGMPPEVVARAFEPFFTTKSPGSGTGLGLATVYAFAKQSGGTAYLESRIGSGTTVTLVLPRHTGDSPAREIVAARRSGRRVVVADDEQSLAEMVAAWLIDMGIEARFATSPKAALELIETFEPDVLVSDANFGEELDGIELARLGTAIVPEMAVVFMTGYSTSMRELQELGERTLAKPFSREDLYAALSPLIAENTESGEQPTSGSSRSRGPAS